jgi:TetR/AcrR family transcriptional repressor of lmrAB and yxaGH operons
MPRGEVRNRMVEGAITLLASKGVEGTSFSEVLAVADAPRGSVYHHFPGGKPELLHSALERMGQRTRELMEGTRGQPARDVVIRFLDLWRMLLDRSNFGAGCAIVAVAVAPFDDEVLDHAGNVFREWRENLAGLLTAGGMDTRAATRFATLLLAATEGAVAISRAERDRRPFDDVAVALLELAPSPPQAKRAKKRT